MKKLTILTALLLPGTLLFAQKEKSEIHKGNQLYKEQKYKEAEASYRKSVAQKSQSVEGNFNLGDALYKQKNFKDAAQKFTDLATSSSRADVKAKAYHNLGNSLLSDKKLQESVDAYKKALLNNPKDEQTRYNLAYAMEKLKQQQQQDKKNNKDGKNKDDKNKDQKNKDQQNKDDKNKDQKDKDDKNKDQKDKDQKDKDDKNKDQQGQQPQPNKLSKEDAERMLQALNNEEKNTQDKLKNKKAKGVKARIVKDW